MTLTSIYICSRCDREQNGTADVTPQGWEFRNGFLVCSDCKPEHPDAAAMPAHNIAAIKDYVRCETAIPLRSGSYLDLADPDCSVVQPIDIAAGLRQARFSAQTRDFYTIAQHSMLVLRLVSPTARKLGGEKGLQLKRCALMHDGAEAFIHDIVKPLKRQLPDYRAIEARLEQRLEARFECAWTDFRREAVKLADVQALAIEQRDLVGSVDAWPILDRIDRDQLQSIKITRCWHPDEAQDRFLSAFEELFAKPERKAA